MRALITGVAGFAGGHLAAYLAAQPGIKVVGCGQQTAAPAFLAATIEYHEIDLRDSDAVTDLLTAVQPDQIYHLAAQAFVPASWADPWDTLETNIKMQLNLLRAMQQVGLTKARLLAVTSNEVYGKVGAADGTPVDEQHVFQPKNPYAVSKVTQDLLAGLYAELGLGVVIARPFNHIGARQAPGFVVPAFAAQVARIEAGLQPPVIEVGNLDALRDFSDVRDVVRAYHLLVERGTPGEAYNIGSGVLRPIRAVLEGLLALSDVRVEVRVDPARLRPVDPPGLCADTRKLRVATGWLPRYSFDETLAEVLNDQRARVAEQLNMGRMTM